MTLRDRARGQSLVEFALVLPILLILMVGLLDFGRAVFAYNSVSNGARSGARVAIVDQNLAEITTAVQEEAFGLDWDDVSVDVDWNPLSDPDCATLHQGCVVEVSVEAIYRPATPLIGNLVGEIAVEASSQMPIERTFNSAAP